LWVSHLEEMDHLRDSVKLRAYGQQDPLTEYKNEGRRIFEELVNTVEAKYFLSPHHLVPV